MYQGGKYPVQIFRDAGFDVAMLGKDRIKSFTKRCKKMAVREAGFTDTRKTNSDHPTTREFSLEEQLERLKHRIKYLEQENEFLKKVEFLDRQAEWEEKRMQRRPGSQYVKLFLKFHSRTVTANISHNECE